MTHTESTDCGCPWGWCGRTDGVWDCAVTPEASNASDAFAIAEAARAVVESAYFIHGRTDEVEISVDRAAWDRLVELLEAKPNE